MRSLVVSCALALTLFGTQTASAQGVPPAPVPPPAPGAPPGTAPVAPGSEGIDTAPPPAPVPPAPVPPPAPAADESMLGGPGESCRARADCQSSLKCVSGTCVDEREGMTCGSTAECGGQLRCVDQVCTNPLTASQGGGKAGGDGGSDFMDFEFEGTHPFIGIDVAGGPSLPYLLEIGDTFDVSGSFLFALKGGVFLGTTELGVEVSPFTFMTYTGTPLDDPHFQFLGYVAHHVPLGGNWHYPIRMGVGMVAGNFALDRVGFQARADLIGVSYAAGPVMIEAHLPSFRFATEFQDVAFFMWQPGVSASYAF